MSYYVINLKEIPEFSLIDLLSGFINPKFVKPSYIHCSLDSGVVTYTGYMLYTANYFEPFDFTYEDLTFIAKAVNRFSQSYCLNITLI